MKKLLAILLTAAMLCSFVSIGALAESKEAINPVKEFPFSMTPSELLAKAEALGLHIIDPYDDPEYEPWAENPVRDGRRDDSYGHFWYEYEEGIMFFFSEGETFQSMSIIGRDMFETPKGVRVGDCMLKVIRKHGICVAVFGAIFQKKTKEGYLFIIPNLTRGTVYAWGISEKRLVHDD